MPVAKGTGRSSDLNGEKGQTLDGMDARSLASTQPVDGPRYSCHLEGRYGCKFASLIKRRDDAVAG